jgi:hypothetical protein
MTNFRWKNTLRKRRHSLTEGGASEVPKTADCFSDMVFSLPILRLAGTEKLDKNPKSEFRNPKQIRIFEIQIIIHFCHAELGPASQSLNQFGEILK